MANFTINDLSTQSIKDDDRILKSNSDGALSKSSFKDIKTYMFTNHPIDFDYPIDVYDDDLKWDDNNMNAVATSEDKVIFTKQFSVPKTGRMLLFLSSVLKTDVLTAALKVNIDGVQAIQNSTNMTTPICISSMGYPKVTQGTHTITITLVSQNHSGTATLYKFNSFRLFGFMLN